MPPPPIPGREGHLKLAYLTQEALLQHTKLQEKIFVNQAKQERHLMMKQQELPSLLSPDHHSSLKRTHSPDCEEAWTKRANKAYKQEGDPLQPPFPLTVQQHDIAMEKNVGLKVAHSLMDGNYVGSPYGMYPAGVPCDSRSDLSISSTVSGMSAKVGAPIKTTSQGKMQWPYYPQAGKRMYCSGVVLQMHQ